MPQIGCYTLSLYCDNYDEDNLGIHSYHEFPHEYHAELGRTCRARARKAGWLLSTKSHVALCPKCSGKKHKQKKMGG